MPQALITSITVLTALDLLIAYLPVLGESRGIGPGVIGFLLSLRAGAGLASQLSMTALLRFFGRRHLLFGAMMTAGFSMACSPAPRRSGRSEPRSPSLGTGSVSVAR